MKAGKDFMSDKPAMTTLEQLAEVRKVQAETKRIYSICTASTTRTSATVKAGELVKAGAIGKVVQTVGLGPHRMTPKTRPEWFFEEGDYGGILTDIASHEFDQFLFFTGSTEATIVASQVGNVNNPKYPGLEDFGDVMVRGNGGMGYIRVDWFTPDGLSTWGDGRLTILGTDGYIEVRKNVDIGGRSGGDHLFLVDQKGRAVHRQLGRRAAVRHAARGRHPESHRDGDAAEARVPGNGARADGAGTGAGDQDSKQAAGRRLRATRRRLQAAKTHPGLRFFKLPRFVERTESHATGKDGLVDERQERLSVSMKNTRIPPLAASRSRRRRCQF